MTMVSLDPDKSQYRINEKYTSISQNIYIQYTYCITKMWCVCVSWCLYVCPIYSRCPDPISCLNDRYRCKLHIYIFKIGMIQSKSSWFAWALEQCPFPLFLSRTPSGILHLLQMLYFFLSRNKKKLWYKCLMLVQCTAYTYTSVKGSIAFFSLCIEFREKYSSSSSNSNNHKQNWFEGNCAELIFQLVHTPLYTQFHYIDQFQRGIYLTYD